jgi:hypothetical protein
MDTLLTASASAVSCASSSCSAPQVEVGPASGNAHRFKAQRRG